MSKIPPDHWLLNPARAGDPPAGPSACGTLAALHRRWAALVDEHEALDLEIDERQTDAGLRVPEVAFHGLYCRSDDEIDEAIDAFVRRCPPLFPDRPRATERRRGELKAALAVAVRAWETGIHEEGIAPLIGRRDVVNEELDATLDEIA